MYILLRPHADAHIIAALKEAMSTATEYGSVLVSDVRLSHFDSISEYLDEHGFSFTSHDTSSQPDPIGSICLTKEPSLPHEMAHGAVVAALWTQLVLAGLDGHFMLCGLRAFPFGPGRRKEADASPAFKRE